MARSAQVSMEFVVFLGIGFVLSTVVILMVLNHQDEQLDERENREIKDLAGMIEEEIIIASTVEHGYWRNFTIDEKLPSGRSFTLAQNGTYLMIHGEKELWEFQVPSFNGTLQKGHNIICNRDGGVWIGVEHCG